MGVAKCKSANKQCKNDSELNHPPKKITDIKPPQFKVMVF